MGLGSKTTEYTIEDFYDSNEKEVTIHVELYNIL